MKSFAQWIRRRGLARIVAQRRAFAAVVERTDPFEHMRLYGELERLPHRDLEPMVGSLVPANMRDGAMATLRQRLAMMLVAKLAPDLLLFLARGDAVEAAMPLMWRQHLAQRGIKVCRQKSAFAWMRVVAARWLNGLRHGRYLWRQSKLGPACPDLDRTYLVVGVPAGAIDAQPDNEGYTFMDWLMRQPEFTDASSRFLILGSGSRNVHHPRIALTETLYYAHTPLQRWRFRVHLLATLAKLSAKVLAGNWTAAILAKDIIDDLYLQFLPHPVGSVYTCTHYAGRPLYDYRWNAEGILSRMIFYSSNNFSFYPAAALEPIVGYPSMNWPEYWLASEQNAQLHGMYTVAPMNVRVTGHCDFVEDPSEPLDLPANCVAIFDVPPRQLIRYLHVGAYGHYYTGKVAAQFLQDVCEVTLAAGLKPVLKRKRDIRNRLAPEYRRVLERFEMEPQTIQVAPMIAPRRLVQQVRLAIGIPFTSALLVAHRHGVPSAYYDPTGTLGERHLNATGLPILTSKAALDGWIRQEIAKTDVMATVGRM